MSRALPAHFHPFRLARRGESLAGDVAPEQIPGQMPRLANMLEDAGPQTHPVRFELRFGVDDSGQACVLGHIEAELAVLCQRCLEPMSLRIERPVSLALVRSHQEAAALDERYDPLLAGDEPLSPASVLEDELILALPNFARHADGECRMPPGADVHADNAGKGGRDSGGPGGQLDDDAGEAGKDNPFSVLSTLKSRNSS